MSRLSRLSRPADRAPASLPAVLLLLALLAPLAGCGFHLRGGLDLPPELARLHLVGGEGSAVRAQLQRDLELAGIALLPGSEGAAYTVELGAERFQRTPVSVDDRARTAQYHLELGTTVAVRDAEGRIRLAPVTVSRVRIHRIDRDNVLGSTEQEQLLRTEMTTDVVRQLVRRIEFIASEDAARRAPPAAPADAADPAVPPDPATGT